jgi:hypothetical protein
MKYFALFTLFFSLSTFASDNQITAQKKLFVQVNNNSNETISCWLSIYPNSAFLPARLKITPNSSINLSIIPETNISLFRLIGNTNTCLADFELTSENKNILITSQFKVQKKSPYSLWT